MAFRFVQCNQAFNVVNVKLHNSGTLGLGTSGNLSVVKLFVATTSQRLVL